jgi:hypothetical protein
MRRLRTFVTLRVNRSVAWRVAEHLEPVRKELDERLQRLDDSVSRRLEALDRRLDTLDRRLEAVDHQASWSANELARLGPQAAAFESRLEERSSPHVLVGELADLPEARSLVEAVREEHARVRARLALVSAYEERLRRLEERVLAPEARG